MNKKLAIYSSIILAIVLTIVIVLISVKVDYYKQIPYEIRDSNVLVNLDYEPRKILINFNSNHYDVHNWMLLDDKTYLLDFSINKEPSDKVFCYVCTKRLNCLSYIFKVVFNI